jgi:hypothetical protein
MHVYLVESMHILGVDLISAVDDLSKFHMHIYIASAGDHRDDSAFQYATIQLL